MPSALNLAFPREKPTAVRAAAALPAVLALAALPPTLWVFRHGREKWAAAARVLGPALAFSVLRTNADRISVAYAEAYCQRVLHASEAAELISGFYRLTGSQRDAFYVAYPHWFDSRLVGMWTGLTRF